MHSHKRFNPPLSLRPLSLSYSSNLSNPMVARPSTCFPHPQNNKRVSVDYILRVAPVLYSSSESDVGAYAYVCSS